MFKLFDGLIYLTSKLDAVKDNPFKCKHHTLDDAYCPITQAWHIQLLNHSAWCVQLPN